MLKFDWSVSIGNIITCLSFVILAVVGWKDLTWRITNLEVWRKEHMIDECSRDEIIKKLDNVIQRIDQRERDREEFARQRRMRRGEE